MKKEKRKITPLFMNNFLFLFIVKNILKSLLKLYWIKFHRFFFFKVLSIKERSLMKKFKINKTI